VGVRTFDPLADLPADITPLLQALAMQCHPTTARMVSSSRPSGPSDDHPQYPIEILNRATRVFGVGGYMLGERLLHCLGLVVSVVDNDSQPFPRRRD
jgi:hypothetical protein